jgi:hypothetical protein
MRLAFAVLLASAALSPAWAQATLVQSSPATDAAGPAPRSLKLTFSEKLAPSSGIQLSMADGMAIPARTSLSDDGKTLTARPTAPFMAGKWTLSWHAVTADGGRRSDGAYIFTVK